VTATSSSIASLCDQIAHDQPELAPSARAIREALQGPLRVALAGRVKAGKSTLLNALVGERLAPTDAAECTRLVTWYSAAPNYQVSALLVDGSVQPLRFSRAGGELAIDLGGRREEEFERLQVGWPSQRLQGLVLIDTPGLGSRNDEVSARSLRALGEGRAPEVDAIVYLMRHAHTADEAFLDSFREPALDSISPINALGVLSRADEIVGGRVDGMASAAKVAARYSADRRLRALVAGILPVSGLLAETAATLREDEYAALRSLASEGPETFGPMLLSADRFLAPPASVLTVERRTELVARLGMFGLRTAMAALTEGSQPSSSTLAATLEQASGIGALRAAFARQFASRAGHLKEAMALRRLRDLAMSAGNSELLGRIEALESSSPAIGLLSVLHQGLGGDIALSPEEEAEVARLIAGASPAEQAGLGAHAAPSEVGAVALQSVSRWREKAGDILAGRATALAAETVARAYERMYAEVMAPGRT